MKNCAGTTARWAEIAKKPKGENVVAWLMLKWFSRQNFAHNTTQYRMWLNFEFIIFILFEILTTFSRDFIMSFVDVSPCLVVVFTQTGHAYILYEFIHIHVYRYNRTQKLNVQTLIKLYNRIYMSSSSSLYTRPRILCSSFFCLF